MATAAQPAVSSIAATGSATADKQGTLAFRSSPDGIDITIDGKFVGSTPSKSGNDGRTMPEEVLGDTQLRPRELA